MTLLDLRQPSRVPCPAFTQTLRALDAACPLITIETEPPGTSLLPAARPVDDPAALDTMLIEERRRIAGTIDADPRPDAVAMWALHGYAWYACLMLAGPWFLARRVPHLGLRDVWIDTDTDTDGTSRSFTVTAGTFSCLPNDPDALAVGARVVPDEAALRAELLRRVTDHLEPLLTTFRPHLRRGERVMWEMVADEVISAVWYLGRALGEEDRAVHDLDELLPGNAGRFKRGTGFRTLPGTEGRTHLTRTQNVCCLWYTLEPQTLCGTCPRADDAHRVRILEGVEVSD